VKAQGGIKMLEEAGVEEVYCMWYYCPKCGDDMIKRSFEYCPNCGIKLSDAQSHNTEYMEPDGSANQQS
jgi:predicted RNA-binding Zn-ribbon protein involved in translation (DUF1610 family)